MKSDEAKYFIKSKINIADYIRRYVDLRSTGGRLLGLCPFHQEKTPSFNVNEERGIYYCFGCQATGDIFEFAMRINGYGFRDAIENFADELGISIEYGNSTQADFVAKQKNKEKLNARKIHALATKHFSDNFERSDAKTCLEYIKERGLSSEIIKQFSLGYSLDAWQDLANAITKAGFTEQEGTLCGLLSSTPQTNNKSSRTYDRFRGRLMFPIFSLTGDVVAFGGRFIPQINQLNQISTENSSQEKQEAKYINSSDTNIYKKGEHLYGLYQARKEITIKHSAMITEGYMDVITLHQFGFTNAIAVLGTALTDEQIKKLSPFCTKVELLFDGDNAGRNAAFKSAQMLMLAGFECKVVLFPEKEDIDSLLRKEDGLNLFASLRANAQEGLLYLTRFKKEISLLEAIKWAKEFLSQVQVPEIISLYASVIARELGIDEAEIRYQLARNINKNSSKKTFDKRGNNTQNTQAGIGKSSTCSTQSKDLQRDRLIITFAVRYPTSIPKLEQLGAGIILKSEFALEIWKKLTMYPPEKIFDNLNSQQKTFWLQSTEGDAPPRTSEEGEFFAVQKLIQKYQLEVQKLAISAALRQGNTDLQTQGEYLKALQEEHLASRTTFLQ